MATLIVLTQPAVGTRIVLQRNRQAVVGRDSACDLILNKQSVSRFHAQVLSTQAGYFLEDLQSTNGTYLNGRKVHSRLSLCDGDRITVHDIPIAFYLSDNVPEESESRVIGTSAMTMSESDSTRAGISTPTNEARQSDTLRGRLKTLVEITRDLGSTLEIEEILPRILDLLFRLFPAAVIGEIHLLGPDRKLSPVAMKHGREADSTDLTGAPFNLDFIQQVFESGRGSIRTEGGTNAGMALDGFFQSTLCAPILGAMSSPCGIILLETNDSSYEFGDDDLELLTAVAVLAGQAIGYSKSHDIVVQHNNTIRQMETARQIQFSMLPRRRPELPGYAFAQHYAPAEKVGGDYFFYETLRDERVILGIADASGKGLPAAMHIAGFAGEVRLRIATSPTLKAALSSLNHFVCEGGDDCMFITACLGVLDPMVHAIALANAGHPPPLLRRHSTGQVEELTGNRRNFPLGVDSVFDAHPWSVALEPGDQLLFFTDGVTEAMNPLNQLFGTERLMEVLKRETRSVEQLMADIVNAVDAFRDGRAANDDMTMISIERLQLPSD